MSQVENPVALNRAEELGFDLWNEFVIPPYYNQLNLLFAKKPRVIVGGRGCGKTMLLRYLCHQSQFSQKRVFDNNYEIGHIGIYWKIDTQFAKVLHKRGIDNADWQSAFQHLSTISISQEILKSLESIAFSSFNKIDIELINKIDFSSLKDFSSEIPSDYKSLRVFFRKEFNKFQMWANNTKKIEEPTFFPKGLIIQLINEIKTQCDALKSAVYFVYIDEYENILGGQQNLVNTWLKHSEPPCIFNIAMKRESFNNRSTIGAEQLVRVHDYTEYDLESFFDDDDNGFKLFAAEILFLRLSGSLPDLPIDVNLLRSSMVKDIDSRLTNEYESQVLTYARKYFPGLRHIDLAEEVFSDKVLYGRLITLIKNALLKRKSDTKPEKFISKKYPQESIIMFALLNRSIQEDEILNEFSNLKKKKESKFANWVDNNFIGCLLLIYEPLPRSCKFYSGFDTLCKMARFNIRHFLELCSKSIRVENSDQYHISYSAIDPEKQAEGAKQASTTLLKEIARFGNNGLAMHKFIQRLGLYFAVLQKNPSQSEPEQNHFSIKNGIEDNKVVEFLSECLKWSVLYEDKSTKKKGGYKNPEIEESQFFLNPVYAPYFHISFRRKRKTEIKESDLKIMIEGDNEEFKIFLTKKAKFVEEKTEYNQLNLFQYFK